MKKYMEFIIEEILGNVIKVLGISLILTVLLQVLARSLHGSRFTWTEEAARLLFLWFSFLSTSLALSKKVHLSIDFFYNKMNPTLKKISDYICYFVLTGFSFVITYYGFSLVKVVHMQKSPILRLPMSYFYAPVPVAGLLFTMYLLSLIIDKIVFDLKQGENTKTC